MQQKRKIAKRQVYKWKAHLYMDGSNQWKVFSTLETFSPETSGDAIQMVLIATSKINSTQAG
jgi:hypothetical protein